MSAEPTPTGPVDFALLHADEHVTYECRRPGEPLVATIGRHIPNLTEMRAGRGAFRFYRSDPDGPNPAINVLADTVSYGLGLFHNWWDLVAVSMAPDPATGEAPPLRPEVLATIAEVEAGIRRWGHTFGATWTPPLWQTWP
jgi:hypothetical protein